MRTPAATVVWDDRFRAYDFGLGHPFSETPRYLAVQLLRAWLADGTDPPHATEWINEVAPASKRELANFHHSEYLDLVERASEFAGHLFLDRGDTPSFPGCFEASARLAGGFLRAAQSTEETGQPAFHPAGGLHHASPSSASGFCIFNDLAVGLASEWRRRPSTKIAYIDIDAHHGDGVMYGFYGDGRLLDIDFHQDGRTLFPGTGRVEETGAGDGSGLKANIALPPGAGDDAFIPIFSRVVPVLIREFRPSLVVLQHGVDAHVGDRLAQLQYTRASYVHAVSTLHELCNELGGVRFVVTGGGGYTPAHVACRLAEAGAMLVSGREPVRDETPVPAAWRSEFRDLAGEEPPVTWNDTTPAERSRWSPEHTDRLVALLARNLGRRFPAEDSAAPHHRRA